MVVNESGAAHEFMFH